MSTTTRPHFENDDILIPRRSKDQRLKNYGRIVNKQIDRYIKNDTGEKLDLSESLIKIFNPHKLISTKYSLYLWACPNLTDFHPDNLEVIGRNLLLSGCKNLQRFNPPNLKCIQRSLQFQCCENLTEFDTPKLKYIGGFLDLQKTPFGKQFDNDSNKCRQYLLDKFGLTVKGMIYL